MAEHDFPVRLFEAHRASSGSVLNPGRCHSFIDAVAGLLFPHFSAQHFTSTAALVARIEALRENLADVLKPIAEKLPAAPDKVSADFCDGLSDLRELLLQDAEAIFAGDPAAASVDEVIVAYPGFFAIMVYRIAHEFYRRSVPLFPRIITEYAHRLTGIDIHPGATIGRSFCIDHGTGIVIGQTTLIKDRVKMYQGVTLGALSVDKSLSLTKRHPTIEEDVVIYANATILGGQTTIGRGSVIGGNVWITDSVPSGSLVYHTSELKVRGGNGSGKSTKVSGEPR